MAAAPAAAEGSQPATAKAQRVLHPYPWDKHPDAVQLLRDLIAEAPSPPTSWRDVPKDKLQAVRDTAAFTAGLDSVWTSRNRTSERDKQLKAIKAQFNKLCDDLHGAGKGGKRKDRGGAAAPAAATAGPAAAASAGRAAAPPVAKAQRRVFPAPVWQMLAAVEAVGRALLRFARPFSFSARPCPFRLSRAPRAPLWLSWNGRMQLEQAHDGVVSSAR